MYFKITTNILFKKTDKENIININKDLINLKNNNNMNMNKINCN